MKVYLKVNESWKLFDINQDSEELEERNITIGYHVVFGNEVRISNNVTLDNGIILGNFTTINDSVIIGNDVIIGNGSSVDSYSVIGDDVLIGEYSSIGKNNNIGKEVMVGNGVSIGDNVRIYPDIVIGNCIDIVNNIEIVKPPMYIQGTRHPIAECGVGLVQIGSLVYTIDYWLKNIKKLLKEYNYNEDAIKEYKEHLKYISKHLTIK